MPDEIDTGWSCRLPPHCVSRIFEYLDLTDRGPASLVCRHWYHCGLLNESTWRHLVLSFTRSSVRDQHQLGCIEQFGGFVRQLTIKLDQKVKDNRLLAVECLNTVAQDLTCSPTHLSVVCVGENPLFYGGAELIQALKDYAVFVAHNTDNALKRPRILHHLNLSKFPFTLTDSLLISFSSHFESLRYVNLQSRCLLSQVTSTTLLSLVNYATGLTDLRVFYSSLDDHVLVALAKRSAKTFRHLSILAKRQDALYPVDVSGMAWCQLSDAIQLQQATPLNVTFKFDYTCPMMKIRSIAQPSAPVSCLKLESYTVITPILQLLVDMYADTLAIVVIRSQPDPNLDAAILSLVERCDKLKQLHVLCPLEEDTIKQIYEKNARLPRTLKDHTADFGPWVYDRILDEIHTNSGWPRQ